MGRSRLDVKAADIGMTGIILQSCGIEILGASRSPAIGIVRLVIKGDCVPDADLVKCDFSKEVDEDEACLFLRFPTIE